MGKQADLTGQRFGRLLVLKQNGTDKHHNCLWECKCDCGNITYATGTSLRRGHKRSCGCLMRDECGNRSRKHGLYKDRLYHIFFGINQGCENPKATAYEWALSNGYEDGLTLDRIDVNGNYEPSNCRWITHQEQMRNTRKTRYLTIEGETKPLIEWCEIYGVSFETASSRFKRGWTNPTEILFGRQKGELRNGRPQLFSV